MSSPRTPENSDLFSWTRTQTSESQTPSPEWMPLAHRIRPRTLEEFAGQQEILGPNKPLRKWIETDQLPSLIFWGPPGCGKTTLAQIVAQATHAKFESISAVLSGVKDIKEAVEKARQYRSLHNRKTILFVDEIHRFNKAQQDALLPHVEEGTLTLIGATTENPSFEINRALLSRCRVIRLEALQSEDLVQILKAALEEETRGLKGKLLLSEEALQWIAASSEGDARKALTTLENIAFSPELPKEALSLEQAQEALTQAKLRPPIAYDKSGEEHYNVISGFIKSLRDSDPHASLYYLARMLEGGEDPKFIARRMVILASEDIGNADPRALQVAIAVKEAVEFVGMPECRINLAQGVTYLACAPKSNASYEGIEKALSEVRNSGTLPVPMHLRNAVTSLMKKHGYGKGYQYAHKNEESRVKQTHLPEKLIGKRFYYPKNSGLEKTIQEKLNQLNSDFEN